jgi:predicted MFS family arabinose efflux permease
MVGAIGWRGVFVFAAVASAIQLPFLLTLAERARANLAEMPSGTGAKKGRTLIDQNLRAPLLWIVLAAMSTTWVAFLLANWLPFLIERDGLSRALAAGSITGLVAGTAVGSFLLGKLIDRHPSPFKLVAAAILCAVPLLLLLSATALPAAGLLVVSALIGSSVVAASLTTMTLVGKVFPERSRVSAAGWLVVSTKLAGLVAPALGGAMLAMGANMSQIFLVAALASVLGAVSLLIGRHAFRARAGPAPESP